MTTPNNKGLKEAPTDEGFNIFGCQIPQNVVGFCKKFLKRHPKWDVSLQEVIPEKNYETARIISHNYGGNLINLEGFTGAHLALTLENVMRENLKRGDVTFTDVLGQTVLLEDLKNAVTVKTKKKTTKPSQLNSSSTSTPRKRPRSVLMDQEDSDNETVDDQGGEEDEETDQESESENEVDDNTTANESTVSLPEYPATPTYAKPAKKPRRSSKTKPEKKVVVFDGSDSDSFDPIVDEDLNGYNPLGDIKPRTKRLVIKGANKNYYGL